LTKIEGDQEAVLFIVQIAVGAVAWILMASLTEHRLLGETLGSVGMWAAVFPFARRTWAASVPVWRYWAAAATGAVLAEGLRALTLWVGR
jgi:hypothetical protein